MQNHCFHNNNKLYILCIIPHLRSSVFEWIRFMTDVFACVCVCVCVRVCVCVSSYLCFNSSHFLQACPLLGISQSESLRLNLFFIDPAHASISNRSSACKNHFHCFGISIFSSFLKILGNSGISACFQYITWEWDRVLNNERDDLIFKFITGRVAGLVRRKGSQYCTLLWR